MTTSQSEITYLLCGGAGINIGVALKEKSRTDTNKAARFIGLDASGANDSKGLFEVERMLVAGSTKEQSSGSGKVKSTNYPQAEAFIEQVLTKYKPTRYTIVVCGTSGGSGSMLGFMAMRALKKAGHVVVVCLINDFTSQVEQANAVGTLRSYANQCAPNMLNSPIPYLEFNNTPESTRGEVNDSVVDKLNLISLFFTEGNQEMDYQDIKNLLNYSEHYGVPPALSRIRFYDNKALDKYNGKPPVAVASLFETSDAIAPRFLGTVVRATGVFKENANKPTDASEMHMVLDHGEALEELEGNIQKLEDRKVVSKGAYVQQKDLSHAADGNGFEM